MDKETLISLALKLVEEALYARAYMDVLAQFNKNIDKYREEVLVSSTFYGVVESALIEAMTIRLARLFDHSDKGISIGYFMKLVEDGKEFFPINVDENTVIQEGHENEYDLPFLYTLKACEECFFTEKIVDRDELIRKAGFPVSRTKTISVTHQEMLDVYHKRFSSLGRQKDALREQRNKIYAHNDKGIRFSFEDVLYLLTFLMVFPETLNCWE